jgi:hypothetical protein
MKMNFFSISFARRYAFCFTPCALATCALRSITAMRYAIFYPNPKGCSIPISAFYHILQGSGEPRQYLAGFCLLNFPLNFLPALLSSRAKTDFYFIQMEPLAKVFFCGSTSSPRTEKLNKLHSDEWQATCGSGLGTVLSDNVSDDTSDDSETGRKGTHQPDPRAGSINQTPG